jgi:hypothetical protein
VQSVIRFLGDSGGRSDINQHPGFTGVIAPKLPFGITLFLGVLNQFGMKDGLDGCPQEKSDAKILRYRRVYGTGS